VTLWLDTGSEGVWRSVMQCLGIGPPGQGVPRQSSRYADAGTILSWNAHRLPACSRRARAAELIAHGRSGFLVASESEARAVIRELQRDPDLRHSIGIAARATLVATVAAQRKPQRNFYLPWPDERAE
jgi:hypothetical protein